jgi:hypothetical protein
LLVAAVRVEGQAATAAVHATSAVEGTGMTAGVLTGTEGSQVTETRTQTGKWDQGRENGMTIETETEGVDRKHGRCPPQDMSHDASCKCPDTIGVRSPKESVRACC